jgi:hypothetical protein
MIKQMKHLFLTGLFLVSGAMVAQAVPVPVGPASAESGDGLNSKWVQVAVGFQPNSIAQAKNTLAKELGDPGFIAEINQIVSEISFSDYGQAGTLPVPAMAGDDPRFAVEYSGFLNVINPGEYLFGVLHDDGFEFRLGGGVVSQFDANTAPIFTQVSLTLAAGLYDLNFIGWEQGGVFINQLYWVPPDQVEFSLVPQRALFTRAPDGVSVPDTASSAVLLLLGFFGVMAGRRCLPVKP